MKIRVQTLTGETVEVEVEDGSAVKQLKVRPRYFFVKLQIKLLEEEHHNTRKKTFSILFSDFNFTERNLQIREDHWSCENPEGTRNSTR